MAVNVDTVYKTVLLILNKEQRGYITPDEFNKIGTQVQLEIFENYFEDLNQQLRVPENDTEYANRVKNVDEKIDIFKTTGNGTYNDPYFYLPSDLHRLGTVIYKEKEVQRTQRNELLLITRSPLTTPTTQDPVYLLEGKHTIGTLLHDIIYVYPAAIIADISASYLKKPISPRWGYSVGSLGQYVYDNTVYDSTSGSLVVFPAGLTSSITTNTVNGIDATYSGAAFNTNAVTTSGSGINGQISVTVGGGLVTDVTVTTAGSGYAVGDTIEISDSVPPNGIGGSASAIITLTADDLYSTSTYGSTNFELHPSEQIDIILNILMYSGVVIRDPQIVQNAAQMVQQDEVNAKS